MTEDERAVVRRRNTIEELKNQMWVAQRHALLANLDAETALVIRAPTHVGVWKGGC